ncbi:MAG: glycosyltransferase family 4 protein [Candidatus Gribaldobacteria bacterium]|nr:glycosyltransferase family 4 protein [Candidatus Gribaldobacteria bacterium]
MFIFNISCDWRNIYINDLDSVKAKLLRDGFNLDKDKFFIVSSNKLYLGYKKIDQQFEVFYLLCPQILLPFFLLIAPIIFLGKTIVEKPNLCYATTPFMGWVFWPLKYFLKIPVFCNYVSSVSQIIEQKGGLKRKIAAKLVSFFEFMGAKMADVLMPNSQWLKQKLLNWRISSSKIVFRPVRPPQIENNSAQVIKLGETYNLVGKKVIFTVARLEKEKNIALVLQAIPLLKDNNTVWLIAGSGSQEAALKKQAEELGLQDRIIFLGYIDHERIWPYYELCSVFVLSSLSEGMPTVILEAMLMSKPVVASNIAGNRELVTDQATGLLFNPASASELAEKINQILSGPDLANSLVQQGKQKALAYVRQYKSIKQIYQYFLAKL